MKRLVNAQRREQDGSFSLKRVGCSSPSLGKNPPEGAVVLLNGQPLDEMIRSGNRPWFVGDMSHDGWAVWEVPIRTIVANNPHDWPSVENVIPDGWELADQRQKVDVVLGIGEDGSLQVPRGGMQSRQAIQGDFDLHVEFLCPLKPDSRSQGRGNSCVFLPCRTEIQVLYSFGMVTYVGGGCGRLYKWKDPDAMDALRSEKEYLYNAASLPPLTWQTYDVEYLVREDNGKECGYLTVLHNGIIHIPNPKIRNPK